MRSQWGEIDVIAAMAGHFGTPVIMLSGDQAAANELHEIVPNAELAVVRRCLGRRTCIGLSAAAAREAIREAATAQHRQIGAIKPLHCPGPVTLQSGVHHAQLAPHRCGMRTGAEVWMIAPSALGKDVLKRGVCIARGEANGGTARKRTKNLHLRGPKVGGCVSLSWSA